MCGESTIAVFVTEHVSKEGRLHSVCQLLFLWACGVCRDQLPQRARRAEVVAVPVGTTSDRMPVFGQRSDTVRTEYRTAEVRGVFVASTHPVVEGTGTLAVA